MSEVEIQEVLEERPGTLRVIIIGLRGNNMRKLSGPANYAGKSSRGID